jgi:hypothetical protein
MRGSVLILVSVLALAACSPKTPAAPPAQPAPSAPPSPTASAPAPDSPQAPSVTPETAVAPAPTADAAPPPVHFSPADYPAKERRIAALINNAESRDTSGETQSIADHGRAERQHCTTRACIDHSYAAEEAHLRKWEGSSDIR